LAVGAWLAFVLSRGTLDAMVIGLPSRTVNQFLGPRQNRSETSISPIRCSRAVVAFTPDSSRCLNCHSNLLGHDAPQQAGKRRGRLKQMDGGRARRRAAQQETETKMLQGYIDQDRATPVETSAIPDALFERGLYWASGRSGVVNLVAAHKWFNLAALKGRVDAIILRREVAELMSEIEIAAAQREARAWMAAN
jgi:uncharacterized protein